MNGKHRIEVKKKNVNAHRDMRRLLFEMTHQDLEERIGSTEVRKHLKSLNQGGITVKGKAEDGLVRYRGFGGFVRCVGNSVLGVNAAPYIIPTVVRFFSKHVLEEPLTGKKIEWTTAENSGYSLGLLTGSSLLVLHIISYAAAAAHGHPEAILLPVVTNVASSIYEVRKEKKRKKDKEIE